MFSVDTPMMSLPPLPPAPIAAMFSLPATEGTFGVGAATCVGPLVAQPAASAAAPTPADWMNVRREIRLDMNEVSFAFSEQKLA